MKWGIVGDIHWSKYSSILRLRGEKYSFRLENCIKSINWAEQLCSNLECERMIYLGDFFDSAELNSEEITALKDIVWNSLPHSFLVGNHEMGINDLSYSSSHLFSYIKIDDTEVIDTPRTIHLDNLSVHFIPYILEEHRKKLSDYMNVIPTNRNVVFSHNDLAGVQLGKYTSKNGFSINEIHMNCDLFINGHLHNGAKITDKIINIGNLTGQNFSEDAFNYIHTIFVLDTDTLQIAVYENPYAVNFYKLDFCNNSIQNFPELKSNAVVTLKCYSGQEEHFKTRLAEDKNIITSRMIISPTTNTNDIVENNNELLAINHLDKFKEYILNTLGSSDEVLSELSEVLQ